MSLRLRSFLLLVVLMLGATALTGWLVLRQADAQVGRIAAASTSQTNRVVSGLTEYGQTHGTWFGVSATVRRLAVQTGHRIRVETIDGAVLADSASVEGGRARPTTGVAITVDARPLTDASTAIVGLQTNFRPYLAYSQGLRYAACLTEAGHPVSRGESDALPVFAAGTGTPMSVRQRCRTTSTTPSSSEDAFVSTTNGCLAGGSSQSQSRCLRRAIDRAFAELGPVPVRAYIEPSSTQGRRLRPGPALWIVCVIAAAGIAAAAILTRPVLRALASLGQAAASVAEGRRDVVVAEQGPSELRRVASAFNAMTASLGASEERQRGLVADVSHELRTPLTNIRGQVEACQDGLVDAEEALCSIHEEVLLQQRLLDDLQDLAETETEVLSHRVEPMDVREVLSTTVASFREQFRSSEVTCRFEVPEQPVVLEGDPDRLRQAIGNLVANSLRATSPGGAVVVEVEAIVAGSDVVVIRVVDDGVGIEAESIPHVFERMWRGDRSRSTPGGGLGLAITRQIVTNHRGAITVTSTPQVRTAFEIRIPALPR